MSEATTSNVTGMRRGRGRPRAVDLHDRVFEAALAVYAEGGWSGFTFDAVARKASAGKDAIYRRWESKEHLLVQALCEALPTTGGQAIDTGSLRDDLIELAGRSLAMHLGVHGLAILRLLVEARALPEVLGPVADTVRADSVKMARRIIRRGIERGELPATVSDTLILDSLMGGVLEHVLATPPSRWKTMAARSEAHVAALVDFVLAGARAGATPAIEKSTP
jgi:AcrR family transcriptional regulator